MALKIGDKAPEFNLFSTDKTEVTLSSLSGKNVVLLFIPAAFTGVCTEEFCSIRDEIKDYENLNAQVYGISVDGLFSQIEWISKNGYNFPLLCDFNKTAIAAYDVIHADFAFGMKNVAQRAVYVIDGNGVIQHVEVTPTLGDMPNLQAVKDCLAQLN
jgi:glutaredoxin-dependent peroxiredoxin